MARKRRPKVKILLQALKFRKLGIIGFVVLFAAVGTVMLFFSYAATSSTISGYAFNDPNRNGVMDAGETPMGNQVIWLISSTNTYLGQSATDSTGRYIFSGLADGDYRVEYSSSAFDPLKNTHTPTTTGNLYPRMTVHLVGQASANFGWRPIVYSTDAAMPISTFTAQNGTTIKSYVDTVSAQEIANELAKGSLVGREGSTISYTLNNPTNNYSATAAGWQTSQDGTCGNYSARVNITWDAWLNNLKTVWHEYGHAWSGYYACMVQNDTSLSGYLKARGLYGDSRINSSYAWNSGEMIAEDYRQLFGAAGSQEAAQINNEIPRASEVAGLKEYLSGAYLQAPLTSSPSAPTGLSGSSSLTAEGVQVKLNWTASTGAVSYDIYRNGTKVGNAFAPSVTFTDTGLLTSSSYSYYVKAINTNGVASASSNTITVTTPQSDSSPPSAPTNISSLSQTQTSISLNWSASSDNVGTVGYRVYQIGGSRRTTSVTLVGSPTGTSFTVSGLTKGTSYSFYITAVDSAGNESAPSKTLTIKTKR